MAFDEKNHKKEKKEDKDIRLSDLVKKVVSTGIGAAFMAEDLVREKIQDLPLPKEVVEGLLKNAKATKEEFVGGIKSELKSYLNKINLSKEIDRVLENYDLQVDAKISFKRKDP